MLKFEFGEALFVVSRLGSTGAMECKTDRSRQDLNGSQIELFQNSKRILLVFYTDDWLPKVFV